MWDHFDALTLNWFRSLIPRYLAPSRTPSNLSSDNICEESYDQLLEDKTPPESNVKLDNDNLEDSLDIVTTLDSCQATESPSDSAQ